MQDSLAAFSDLVAWTDAFTNNIVPRVGNGEGYQNYPNPRDRNFAARYWPDAITRAKLKAVRRQYDPTGLFAFPQNV